MPGYKCIILSLLIVQTTLLHAQVVDSAGRRHTPTVAGFQKSLSDSTVNPIHTILHKRKDIAKETIRRNKSLWPQKTNLIGIQIDSSDTAALARYENIFKNRPLLRVKGGYTGYQFNYRSNIDTPFVEKNLLQHNLTGQLNIAVADVIPLRVSYWVRQSNSQMFRDIAQIQIAFDGTTFFSEFQNAVRNKVISSIPLSSDSITKKLYDLKNAELTNLSRILHLNYSPQNIAEAHEILKVPRLTWDPLLSDSINMRREDSIKQAVALMLKLYESTKARYDSVKKQVDSLMATYKSRLEKAENLKRMINGGFRDGAALKNLEKKLQENGLYNVDIPRRYRWLLGLRNFRLGRSNATYSELTAKNVSVNGINLEYNSWYYFALTAGALNYRFREFAINGLNKKPQSIFLIRAGIGSLERNYFIVSAFRGEKQLFASNAHNASFITVSGISAEAKWRLNATTWINAEIAKSFSPDFRNNPPRETTKFTLRDNSNQGFSVRLHTFVPSTKTRLEAFYKKTGANFQSFTSFQTNAALESWFVKAEQNLFKKRLRLTGALRKNEFSNPFIVQNYKSNTLFKSVTASLRVRKWPVVAVGYQPMSQLTYLDERLVENRFQTLNVTLYHLYNISQIRSSSTAMYSQFYNNGSDSGFIYYNARNFYWMQHFLFAAFTTHIGVSQIKNPGYQMNVLEGGFHPNLKKGGSLGIGVRVNQFNNQVIKVGSYINANICLFGRDRLYLSYEHGYLPGSNNVLVRNDMASVQFVKNF